MSASQKCAIFVSFSSTERLLGPAAQTLPSLAAVYPFSSLGTAWLSAENTAEPSGEEQSGQKSREPSPSGVQWSIATAPVREAAMVNKVAAWHNTDNLAFGSLSIIFFHCLRLGDRESTAGSTRHLVFVPVTTEN